MEMRNGLMPACKRVELTGLRKRQQGASSLKSGPVNPEREVASLSAGQLWEWVVDQGGDDCGPSGVSGNRGRAMTQLSRSLISAGGPGQLSSALARDQRR